MLMPTPDPSLDLAERAALVEECFAAVRHDVRNRLASVRSAAFFLRRRADKAESMSKDQKVQSFFDLIDSEVEAADGLLSDPAVLRRNDPKTLAACSAKAAVARAVASARIATDTKVALEVADTSVISTEEELALICRCLIENAADAKGGALIEVRSVAEDTRFVISVTDRGPGVIGVELDQAFSPFVTTRAGRLGLGLAMARRTARRYGAEVSLHSSPEGARAEVTLAIARRP